MRWPSASVLVDAVFLMRRRWLSGLLVLTVGAAGGVLAASTGATHPVVAARWVMTDLGSLSRGTSVIGMPGNDYAVDVNERGQVVGSSDSKAGTHAFLWSSGRMVDLGALGGASSFAHAVNDRGQVVGKAATGNGFHAFLWQYGMMRDLGTLGGVSSEAYALNDHGQVVGRIIRDRITNPHAFLWQKGKMTDLGTLGGLASEAVAINDVGQVVGWSRIGKFDPNGKPVTHAFLWLNGKMTDLGTLHGGNSSAVAINDQGQVVGSSDGHAFLWQNGKMTDLGTLVGDETSDAVAINERGQIVGTSYRDQGTVPRAFLWQNGTMTDLGTPPRKGSWPTDINDQGQVVGDFGSNNRDSVFWQGFVWQSGKLTDLGTLRSRYPGSSADKINNRGEIIGWSSIPGRICIATTECFGSHAVLWTRN